MRFREVSVLVFLIVLVFGLCLCGSVFGADEVEAAAAVEAAEARIVVCYQAVLEADDAGGNVTSLLVRLNVAAQFLSESKFSFSGGNFSGAVYFSGLVLGALSGFEDEALEVTNAALTERGEMFSWMVGGSVFGFAVVGVLGFFGWRFVRERFVRRVLEMKPEVTEFDES